MRKLSQKLLHLIGWRIIGQLSCRKFIIIVAPHTSNWDLIIGLLARFAVGFRIHFLAKHQLFFFPLGSFLRCLGGIAVNRTKNHDMVDQVAHIFNEKENFALAITPEGTRGNVKRWKTGFYHIACRAEVPIIRVGFDYKKKEIIIGEPFIASGDMNKDFPVILDFYREIQGRHPKKIPCFK